MLHFLLYILPCPVVLVMALTHSIMRQMSNLIRSARPLLLRFFPCPAQAYLPAICALCIYAAAREWWHAAVEFAVLLNDVARELAECTTVQTHFPGQENTARVCRYVSQARTLPGHPRRS